jgi:hypothetical protein
MGKAGGVLGILAGVFGVVAALVTLFVGGLGSAFNTDGASTVVGLGWGGILFSFLTLIFGAIAFAKPRWAGIGLIACSILGAVLGGTIVAVCMILSLVGGVLCLFDKQSKITSNEPTNTTNETTTNTTSETTNNTTNEATTNTTNDANANYSKHEKINIPSEPASKSKTPLYAILGVILLLLVVGIAIIGGNYRESLKIEPPPAVALPKPIASQSNIAFTLANTGSNDRMQMPTDPLMVNLSCGGFRIGLEANGRSTSTPTIYITDNDYQQKAQFKLQDDVCYGYLKCIQKNNVQYLALMEDSACGGSAVEPSFVLVEMQTFAKTTIDSDKAKGNGLADIFWGGSPKGDASNEPPKVPHKSDAAPVQPAFGAPIQRQPGP